MVEHLSVYAPSLGLELPRQTFGKDVANRNLFRALVQHAHFSSLTWLTAEAVHPDQLQKAFLDPWTAIGEPPAVFSSHLLDLQAPCQSGFLLRGQPYIAELAWMRSAFRRPQAYSLVGLIHTLAPPAVREQIGAAAVAPVQPWDALICTSPSVKRAVQNLFDQLEAHLWQRLGANRCIRPQLPLVPLGVDLGSMQTARHDQQARQQLRQQLGVAHHELLVLWVGRLSYFEKAFPQPLFQALGRAAQQLGQRLHLAMAGWFPNGDHDQRLYSEAAQTYSPGVPVHLLDGRDQALLARCWAAADVFVSLVDNPQETFGLSPVEAMAAGLPVVVSDWDGYRYTVRHGVDGFCIPTLGGAGGGIGDELAARHSLGLMSYQDYVGAVAQHTAVDVHVAAAALVRLAQNPELRRRMGEAGRQNVRERFDWPVVIRQYLQLFDDLQQRRQAAQADQLGQLHPLRGNPFADFAGFATAQLQPHTRLALAVPQLEALAALERLTTLDRVYGGCHATLAELQQLLAEIGQQGSSSVEQLVAAAQPARHQSLLMGLSWLAKLGLLRWSSPEPVHDPG